MFRYPDKPTSSTIEFISSLSKEPVGTWIAQAKIDGWRINIFFEKDDIKILTRMGKPLEDALKCQIPEEIKEELKILSSKLPEGTILDGEYVGRRECKKHSIYLFDVVKFGDKWYTNLPYIERWEKVLEITIIDNGYKLKHISLPEYTLDDFGSFYERMKKSTGLVEGVVAKHFNSKLVYNKKRSVDNEMWFKAKYENSAS